MDDRPAVATVVFVDGERVTERAIRIETADDGRLLVVHLADGGTFMAPLVRVQHAALRPDGL